MDVTAREVEADPRVAFDGFVAQIVAQKNDVDKVLVEGTAEVAWTAVARQAVPVASERRTPVLPQETLQ